MDFTLTPIYKSCLQMKHLYDSFRFKPQWWWVTSPDSLSPQNAMATKKSLHSESIHEIEGQRITNPSHHDFMWAVSKAVGTFYHSIDFPSWLQQDSTNQGFEQVLGISNSVDGQNPAQGYGEWKWSALYPSYHPKCFLPSKVWQGKVKIGEVSHVFP